MQQQLKLRQNINALSTKFMPAIKILQQRCLWRLRYLEGVHSHCILTNTNLTLQTQHQTVKTYPCTLNTAHPALHTQYNTLNTTHLTLHTQHYTLNTTHSTLHNQHRTLITANSTQHTQQRKLNTHNYTLNTAAHMHCSTNQNSTMYIVQAAENSKFNSHTQNITLKTAHSTLHTHHCTLNTAH